jgi:hypothetical protein
MYQSAYTEEEKKMRNAIFSILFAVMISLVPLAGFATQLSVEGTIQGFNCVTQGITCPVGKEDPMAAVERVFVLLTDSDDFYFIPNVDRAVLARHINQKIRVVGDMNTKYKSIQASQIQVMKKGDWKNTWGREEEKELIEEMVKLNKML